MKKLTPYIIKLKWPIIALVFALTLFFGWQLKDLHINSDVTESLPDDDPAAKLYKEVGETYGGNAMGMIVLESDNIFQKSSLEHIKQITDSLKIMEGVSTVTSLTDIIDIKNVDGGIEIGKLIDEYELPESPEDLQKLKEYIFSKDMYKPSIISEDGKCSLVLYTIADEANKQDVANAVKQKIESIGLKEHIYYGGLPHMINDISDLILADIIWLLPIVIVLISFILFLSFKSFRGVLLPLLTAGISVIWTLGILQLMGYELTMISNNIPIILLAVGSAYTIHVVNRINQTQDENRENALIQAVNYIAVPVSLAAITTAIGFVSFIFGAYLTMIRDFGIFTSMGTLFALLLALFFVPAVISAFGMYSNKANEKETKKAKENFLIKKVLNPLYKLLLKHPKRILGTWIILLLISAIGIFQIKTSVDMKEYFQADNPSRITEDLMQAKMGGSNPVFVVIKGDMQDPKVLQMMAKTEDYMKAFPNIITAQSVADLIEQMNDVMGEGKKVPDERAKIEQLWFLLDGQDIMSQIVNDDLTEGIIQSKFASSDSKAMEDFVDYMQNFIDENSSKDCSIQITGMPNIYVKMANSLLSSQFSSLGIAVLLVLIIVGLMLKSLKKGLLAALPIVSTIALLFGFMGFAGISLDIATVLVASVALGIGIDYSIHVITHFSHSYKEFQNIEEAMKETILVSGKAIIINVISVASGFIILLFSQMHPLQNFGLLVALAMIGSGAGALTLLPVSLIMNQKRSKQN